MPHRLSLRSTLLLVALAFDLAFAIQALPGRGASAAQPAAKQSAPGLVAKAPGAEPDLSLVAAGTVPALRDPRQPRKRRVHTRKPARRKKPPVRMVVTATPELAPMLLTPTPAPRYIPPAPRRSTPAPRPKPAAPKPKPAPFSTPETSGVFDSSGE
jgi:hypothetical protein